MLIDHRTYRILPGRVPAQLDLYSKLAYPVQLRYMGEPHYYLVSESGSAQHAGARLDLRQRRGSRTEACQR